MNQWTTKWLAASLLCLLLLGAMIFSMLSGNKQSLNREQDALAQAARVKVNEILLYLERHTHELASGNHDESLRKLGQSKEVEVLVLALDGTVWFDSSGKARSSYNPRILLQYDRLLSHETSDRYTMAYPIVGERENSQIGNAIFTMSRHSLTSAIPAPSWLAGIPPVVIVLALAGLLILIAWKTRNHLMKPLLRLREHSEQILKGNYGQRAEHDRLDEIGELYAVFDQMRAEIKHLNTKRMEQDRSRKELITNISHDLKTPLATVKAYIEAIQAGVCPDIESIMSYIEVMKTNTDKMSRLTEDLLLHALQDLGQISVHRTEQYSRVLLEDIIKPMAHYARSIGITFQEPDTIPDVLIAADPQRLEQVVGNLVMNALKHTTSSDAIMINIEHTSDDLIVTITDTGEGISPADMPFVFERYYQGQSNGVVSVHPTQGSGLGLSICKHIVEAHNGTISFRSVKGEGTRFTFTIPVL
ncbi:sensor histidine kinase [Paenibacillus paeoniae]|uniref:histidine kinase n=1 Tax=Paenibacillus paeoniae TaxID=2292705 RepID=A0A371PK05_9BACL|nr:HAMP domain-containing sensor histidine kinase [Paenibacillus paeoniae]REK76117.1 sensor histidine kinase [Paenibacillus paeoniae]